jgi:UDP-N-acetylmuramoyl-tripeptide--D-alanyl-D-alanine ligase
VKKYSSEEIYGCFLLYPSISTDSRKIEKDCLFFALKGENFNGNEYAVKALGNGAAYSIVDEEAFAVNEKCLLVENVLECLQQIAVIHRLNLKIPVIGITGSNGKTTTKELINVVLSSGYKVIATAGNLNNHIGVPLTILGITADTEIGIIEMGANHQGEIAFLSKIAMPDFGIITNIGKAHLGEFGGFEGVIKTKNELYQHLELTNGTAFVNVDDPLLMQLSEKLNRIGYGILHEGINVNAGGEVLQSNPLLTIRINGKERVMNTQLVGTYNLPNVLAAISIGRFFGVADDKIFSAIEHYKPSNNRSQWIETGKNHVILDAYNANPSSMEAALNNFSKVDKKPKVVIIGGMKELGEESDAEHQRIYDLAGSLDFDRIILVGNEFAAIIKSDTVKYFADSEELKEYLKLNPISGANLLVKGSRGIKLEKIVELL